MNILVPEAFGGDDSYVIRRSDWENEDETGYEETAMKRYISAPGVPSWEIHTFDMPWAGVSLPDVYVHGFVRSDRPGPGLHETVVDRTFHRFI